GHHVYALSVPLTYTGGATSYTAWAATNAGGQSPSPHWHLATQRVSSHGSNSWRHPQSGSLKQG
ncbi:MAG: hypothetical protein WCL11_27300, partial [Verrucomicrobiota bacterium]